MVWGRSVLLPNRLLNQNITSVVLILTAACHMSSSNMDSPVYLPSLPCVFLVICHIE